MTIKLTSKNSSQDSGVVRHFGNTLATAALLAMANIPPQLPTYPNSCNLKMVRAENESSLHSQIAKEIVLSDAEKFQILETFANYFSDSETGFPSDFAEIFHNNLGDLLA